MEGQRWKVRSGRSEMAGRRKVRRDSSGRIKTRVVAGSRSVCGELSQEILGIFAALPAPCRHSQLTAELIETATTRACRIADIGVFYCIAQANVHG